MSVAVIARSKPALTLFPRSSIVRETVPRPNQTTTMMRTQTTTPMIPATFAATAFRGVGFVGTGLNIGVEAGGALGAVAGGVGVVAGGAVGTGVGVVEDGLAASDDAVFSDGGVGADAGVASGGGVGADGAVASDDGVGADGAVGSDGGVVPDAELVSDGGFASDGGFVSDIGQSRRGWAAMMTGPRKGAGPDRWYAHRRTPARAMGDPPAPGESERHHERRL